MKNTKPAIWFPTIKTNTGSDRFTEQLVMALNQRGFQAEITWLPHRAEYLPWSVPIPQKPSWANITHINTWLHPRFISSDLPVIATLHHASHDPELQTYKGWLRSQYHNRWIKPIERRVIQRANNVIAVSHFAAHITQLHVLNKPIGVIYNGIDTGLFCSSVDKQSQYPFRLLYVGAWRKLKGVDLLAPIMQELGHDYILYYTGDATLENDQDHVPENMINIGRLNQQQVIEAMQTADAFLFPSKSEGFGLVVAEAMACGLPVVVSDSSALTELVDHALTGFLCEKNRIDDFVQSIRHLKEHPELCVEIGVKARESAVTKFNLDDMVKNYINLYTETISSQ